MLEGAVIEEGGFSFGTDVPFWTFLTAALRAAMVLRGSCKGF